MNIAIFYQVCALLFFSVTTSRIVPEDHDDLLPLCAVELMKDIVQENDTIVVFGPVSEYTLQVKTPFEGLYYEYMEIPDYCVYEGGKSMGADYPIIKYNGTSPFSEEFEGYINTSVSGNIDQNRLLEKIHLSGKWQVILTPTRRLRITITSRINYKTYVLFMRYNGMSFKEILRKSQDDFTIMANLGYLNAEALYIIIPVGKAPLKNLVSRILKYLRNSWDIQNVIYLHQGANDVEIYSWYPYTPPSGVCGRFKKEVLLNTCFRDGSNIKFTKERTLMKYEPDLSCCRISFNEVFPREFPYYNPHLPFIGKVEEQLEEYMGMTNVSCKVAFQVLPTSEYKYSVSRNTKSRFFYTERYTFFLPFADKLPRWKSLSRVFSVYTWLIFFMTIILATCFCKYLSSCGHSREHDTYRDTIQCFLCFWSVILGISVPEMPRTSILRINFSCWAIYSLCISTVFQSFFTTYLFDPGYMHQIDTYEELEGYNLSFTSMVQFDNFAGDYGFNITNRSYVFKAFGDGIAFGLYTKKSVVWTSLREYALFKRWICPKDTNEYYKFSETFSDEHIELFFYSEPLLNGYLSDFLRGMVEGGIADKIVHYRLHFGIKYNSLRKEYREEVPMSLKHLQSLYYFFLMGLLLSVISFVIEIFIAYVSRYSRG